MRFENPKDVQSLNDMFKRVKGALNYKIKTTPKQLELGRLWINDAKETIQSSINSGNTYSALYNWCHGVEQLCKAYGLVMGVIPTDNIKYSIGHVTPNVSVQLVNKVSNDLPLTDILNANFYDTHKNFSKTFVFDKKNKKHQYKEDFLNISDEDFEDLISFCEKSDYELKQMTSAENIFNINNNNDFNFNILNDFDNVIRLFPKEQIIKLIEDILEKTDLTPLFVHPRLLILSIISSSYLELAKYPAENREKLEKTKVLQKLGRLQNIGLEQSEKLFVISNNIDTK